MDAWKLVGNLKDYLFPNLTLAIQVGVQGG